MLVQEGFTSPNDIYKSRYDLADYEEFSLNNGLKVLVVNVTEEKKKSTDEDEDSSMKMAAISLAVNAGSNDEPSEFGGLAHFLEHMLFMGSEKYPKEDDFDSFISKYGGNMNAFTDSEKTCYFFTIGQEKLHDGVDIFVNFFVKPLMKKNSLNKEVEAVDTEFTMATSSNNSHVRSVFNTIYNGELPHTKFNYGNSTTLKDIPATKNIDMRAKLYEFFDEFYASASMTACLLVENIDRSELEKIVKLFEQIPFKKQKKTRATFDWKTLALPARMDYIYHVKAIKDTNTLFIRWNLPPLDETKTSACYHYLTSALGYEGAGTIDYALKQKNYIYSLAAGFEKVNVYLTFLNLHIKLTDLGMEHINEVLSCVFAYTKLMNTKEPSEEFAKDLKHMAQFGFLFKSQDEMSERVVDHAINMHTYPKNHYITEDVLLSEYDSNYIKTLLSCIVPEKAMILLLTSKSTMPMDKKTAHFESQYGMQQIPQEWSEAWKHLETSEFMGEFVYPPAPNNFLIQNFDFKKLNLVDQFPSLISDNNQFKLFYKYDNQFQQPKSVMALSLMNPFYSYDNSNKSFHPDIPDNALFLLTCEIMTKFWRQKITTQLYQAESNDYHINYNSTQRYLEMTFEGFNQHFKKYINICINHMIEVFPTESELTILKDIKKKDFMNSIRSRQQFGFAVSGLYSTDTSNMFDICSYVDLIDMTTLKQILIKILAHSFKVALLQGTLTNEETLSIISDVNQRLSEISIVDEATLNSTMLKPCVYLFPVTNALFAHQNILETDKNSIVINSYKLPPVDYYEVVKLVVLNYMMRTPVFDILRTQEKLGYAVHTTIAQFGGLYELLVMVDFDCRKYKPQYVDSRIEACLIKIFQKFQLMTREEFQEHISGFCAKETKELPNLSKELQRNFNRIMHYYDNRFDYKQLHAKYASKMEREDILEVFEKYLLNKDSRRKFSVQILSMQEFSKKPVADGNVEHDDDSSDKFEVDSGYFTKSDQFTKIEKFQPYDCTNTNESSSQTSLELRMPDLSKGYDICVNDPVEFKHGYCKRLDFVETRFEDV